MAELTARLLGGRYEVLELIGEGGMAEVYKARHIQLDRLVAVKVMHRFLTQDGHFENRFEQEARLVAKLRHPNIIQVYDFEGIDAERLYYMVVEFIDGPSLHEQLVSLAERGEQMALPEVVRISRDVASALGYAHAHGMIHRDIKPSNVLLEHRQRVVLTDFGMAKIVGEASSHLTTSGSVLGTPAYMSPEQALSEPVDARSDLYSLGVMLYQMGTGHLPFSADTPLALALRHVNDLPQPPQVLNRGLTPQLSSIIVRCLAKDPADRYQTAAELLADFNDPGPLAAVSTRPDHEQDDAPPAVDVGTTENKAVSTRTLPRTKERPRRATAVRRVGIATGVIALLAAILVIGRTTFGRSAAALASSVSATATSVPLPSDTSVPVALASDSPTATASELETMTIAPTDTVEQSPTPIPCVVQLTTSPFINVRTGPGLAYPLIGTLRAGENAVVIGVWRRTSSPWWQITFSRQVGWVSNSVVMTTGDCDRVPDGEAPPLPSAATPTAAPDINPTDGGEAPTDMPPTDVPPTDVPPTDIPPTEQPPTDMPPTDVPTANSLLPLRT